MIKEEIRKMAKLLDDLEAIEEVAKIAAANNVAIDAVEAKRAEILEKLKALGYEEPDAGSETEQPGNCVPVFLNQEPKRTGKKKNMTKKDIRKMAELFDRLEKLEEYARKVSLASNINFQYYSDGHWQTVSFADIYNCVPYSPENGCDDKDPMQDVSDVFAAAEDAAINYIMKKQSEILVRLKALGYEETD